MGEGTLSLLGCGAAPMAGWELDRLGLHPPLPWDRSLTGCGYLLMALIRLETGRQSTGTGKNVVGREKTEENAFKADSSTWYRLLKTRLFGLSSLPAGQKAHPPGIHRTQLFPGQHRPEATQIETDAMSLPRPLRATIVGMSLWQFHDAIA